MNDLIKEFLDNKKIAVAGSFRNESKVAYSVLLELKRLGYEVFPVSPNKSEVEGATCYPSVSELPEGIKAINIVTPPSVSITIAEAGLKKGIEFMWFQPGAEDDATLEFCKKNGIKFLASTCILTALADR